MGKIGIVFDVETTGLELKKDEITELAILSFTLEDSPRIIETKSWLNEVKQPLTDEIQKLTGISNDLLSGKNIPWDKVSDLFNTAEVIVAHNAPFDVGFVRKYLPNFKGEFACSMRHIDWVEKGFRHRDLIGLAAENGFVNPFPHRALFDCATTFKLIAPYMNELCERSKMKYIRVDAFGSPFEKKDILKENGYRWNAGDKVWFKELFEDKLENENKFLADQIYNGTSRASVAEIQLF